MKKVIKVSSVIFLFLALLSTVAFFAVRYDGTAFAEDVITVTQEGKVFYSGKSYIKTDGSFADFKGKNELYNSLGFSFGGQKIEIPSEDIKFKNIAEIRLPDTYSCLLEIVYNGKKFEVSANLTVNKKELKVIAKINGESYCVVEEGEKYSATVVYEGFVDGEWENVLTAPAIIGKLPKMPTTGYQIVPELCQSDLYEIVYVGATVVITANPDTERRYTVGDEDVLILRGSFSPCYTLEYIDVGTNKSDPRYAEINAKVQQNYEGNRVFEDYQQASAYRINMYLDGAYADFTSPINVRIQIPDKFSGKEYYRVIHFFNDGTYEFLNATEADGYVSFATSDLGDFVLLTPIEGINVVTIVAICVGIVLGALLILLLATIFRRKY